MGQRCFVRPDREVRCLSLSPGPDQALQDSQRSSAGDGGVARRQMLVKQKVDGTVKYDYPSDKVHKLSQEGWLPSPDRQGPSLAGP